MPISKLVQVVAVDEYGEVPPAMRVRPANPRISNHPDGSASRTLEAIKSKVGKVYLPTRLPEGFTMHSVSLMHNRVVSVVYHPQANRDRSVRALWIVQDSQPTQQKVQRGHFRRQSVKDWPGYLIYGTWEHKWHKETIDPPPIVWDINMCLFVLFDVGDKWVALIGILAKDWTETEIIRIAESFESQ